MRCKQGDLAILLRSVTGKNDGKIVDVSQYIGFFNAEESFDYNGMMCRVPITDHYWWITCEGGLETPIGPTTRAYGPDTWLLPIPKDIIDDDEETGEDIYNVINTSEKA